MNQILFNGLHYTENGAGISRYSKELIKEFIEQDYPLDILMRKEFVDRYEDGHIAFVDKNIKSSRQRIIEEQCRQLKHYKKYELIHFPDYACPIFYKGKKVVTIHDMAMHTMSDKYTHMQRLTKNLLLEQTIKKADQLICISHFTKKELLKYYPEVEEKVKVIYSGIFFPEYTQEKQIEERILEKFHLLGEYILYVGTIAPHKNIEQLILAYKQLRKIGYTHRLVIAGKRGWMDGAIFDRVKEEGLEKNVVFTGFITDNELEVLYRRATFFVSVSLYEGFGFPPLEAMGRGCPVLVSNIDAFQEICKENVLYCNPNEVYDIVKQMEKLLQDDELRTELTIRGMAHVKKFNWQTTAKEVMSVYKNLLDTK